MVRAVNEEPIAIEKTVCYSQFSGGGAHTGVGVGHKRQLQSSGGWGGQGLLLGFLLEEARQGEQA